MISKSEDAMKTIMSVIDSIRSIRGEMNVPPSSEIEVLIQAPDAEIRELSSQSPGRISSGIHTLSQESLPPNIKRNLMPQRQQ